MIIRRKSTLLNHEKYNKQTNTATNNGLNIKCLELFTIIINDLVIILLLLYNYIDARYKDVFTTRKFKSSIAQFRSTSSKNLFGNLLSVSEQKKIFLTIKLDFV